MRNNMIDNNSDIVCSSSFPPSDWVETTLGEVCEIIGGGTPKTTVDKYWNGSIPWLSVVEFNDDNLFVSKYQLELPKKVEMEKFIEEKLKEAELGGLNE